MSNPVNRWCKQPLRAFNLNNPSRCMLALLAPALHQAATRAPALRMALLQDYRNNPLPSSFRKSVRQQWGVQGRAAWYPGGRPQLPLTAPAHQESSQYLWRRVLFKDYDLKATLTISLLLRIEMQSSSLAWLHPSHTVLAAAGGLPNPLPTSHLVGGIKQLPAGHCVACCCVGVQPLLGVVLQHVLGRGGGERDGCVSPERGMEIKWKMVMDKAQHTRHAFSVQPRAEPPTMPKRLGPAKHGTGYTTEVD